MGRGRIRNPLVTRYSSVREYGTRALNNDPANRKGTASTSVRAGADWSGGLDFKGAVAQAEQGWPEGGKALKRIVSEAMIAARATLVDREYALTDDATVASTFDLSSYLSGDPEHWITCAGDNGSIRTPVTALRMAVRTAWSSIVGSTQIAETLGVAIGVALGVQAHGIPVYLDAVKLTQCTCYGAPRNRDTYDAYAHVVRLIAPGYAPSYDMLAAASHASFPRRLGFNHAEHSPGLCECMRDGSMGTPGAFSSLPKSSGLVYNLAIETVQKMTVENVVKRISVAVKGENNAT
jgi:hypothetical protein